MTGQRWLADLAWEDDRIPNTPLVGRACVVVGGGPSLTRKVVQAVQPYPVIYANNAFYLASEPSLVVALDRRWYEWHGQGLKAGGHIVITALRAGVVLPYSGEHYAFDKDRDGVWPGKQRSLPGKNSGHAACALAYLLGARAVYLIGFDMGFVEGKSHWHSPHNVPPSEANYRGRFRPDMEALSVEAHRRGRVLASITETQADLPRVSLANAIEDLAHEENGMDHAEASAPLPK